jgi:hypothetical protein
MNYEHKMYEEGYKAEKPTAQRSDNADSHLRCSLVPL